MFHIALVLSALLPAQDPAPVSGIDKLRAHVERAEAFAQQLELPEARTAAQAAWSVAQNLSEERRRDDEVHALLWQLGRVALSSQDARTAHDVFTEVTALREATLPADHHDLQRVRLGLAIAKKTLGDLHGALELEQKVLEVRTRTRPEDHPDLLLVFGNLAITRISLGDLHGANAMFEKVLEAQTAALPDDHPVLQKTRTNLAVSKRNIGDLKGALQLQQKVFEIRARTLPDNHPDLIRARLNLATTMTALGDFRRALPLHAQVVEAFSRLLPDDHPELQTARTNLAATMTELGDLHGGLPLQEKVLEIHSRTLPDDHPELQRARVNLATTKHLLGDLHGTIALEEKVHAVMSTTLPDDHLDLQRVRSNMAATKFLLGDLQGALVLQEKVLEVLAATFPDDHSELLSARSNLAATRRSLGDYPGALALAQKVFEIQSSKLADNHPDLQKARGSLANSKYVMGDLRGAHALEKKVVEVRSLTHPEDHPHLLLAIANLALTTKELGDLQSALALEEQVLSIRNRTLPDDHPALRAARINLAATELLLGKIERAAMLARKQGTTARQRIAAWTLAPREVGAMAREEYPAVDQLLTLAQGFGATAAQPKLADDALLVSQTLRGSETRTARSIRRARASDAAGALELEGKLREAVAEVQRIAGTELPEKGEGRQAKLRQRNDELARAVAGKETLQRALVTMAAASGGFDPSTVTLEDLAAQLPEQSAAATVLRYSHFLADSQRPGVTGAEDRLAALVLDRDAQVQLVPLGTLEPVETWVRALLDAGADGAVRGQKPRQAKPLRDPAALQQQLRHRLIDPILEATADAKTLFLAVDAVLELVPIDALARGDGEPLGTMVAIRPLVSLFDLLEPVDPIDDQPMLVAVGGLDYDAAVPPVGATRAGNSTFAALAGTSQEVEQVVASFAEAFETDTTRTVTGRAATKKALIGLAPKATFLHVATHGYFAAESITSSADLVDTPLAMRQDQRISGLSPLLLTGLALSGANLPPDDLGRRAGILTAEEILSLDLSHCYLVTLSACDTSLGVRRAGQGYASLKSALLGAGARFVVTSLWKVGDQETMDLMADFYRRMWVEKSDPHQALWDARMAARQRGAPFRDWAGWVLTGR